MPWQVDFEETVCDELKFALLRLTPKKWSSKICKQELLGVGMGCDLSAMDALHLLCRACQLAV